MQVHLPKPLHGWRPFAGEVGVIVLGVLIALAAQQAVESFQWRDKVGRAEAAMRLELAEDDGPQAYGRMAIGACLDQQITRIRDGAGRMPTDLLRRSIADYAPPFRTWDSEAWKAVLSSDVGSHMGPDRLVAWSSPYRIMPGLTDANQREVDIAADLHEILPPSGEPSGQDLAAVRRLSEELRILNSRLVRGSALVLARSRQNDALVPQSVQKALLDEARTIYGACVRTPDLNARPEAQSLGANLRAGVLGFR